MFLKKSTVTNSSIPAGTPLLNFMGFAIVFDQFTLTRHLWARLLKSYLDISKHSNILMLPISVLTALNCRNFHSFMTRNQN